MGPFENNRSLAILINGKDPGTHICWYTSEAFTTWIEIRIYVQINFISYEFFMSGSVFPLIENVNLAFPESLSVFPILNQLFGNSKLEPDKILFQIGPKGFLKKHSELVLGLIPFRLKSYMTLVMSQQYGWKWKRLRQYCKFLCIKIFDIWLKRYK